MIKFTAPIEPVPFKRVQWNGNHRFTDPRYRNFKDALSWYALQAMHGNKPLKGAIKLLVDVFKHGNTTSLNFGDHDNHLKAVSDALNGICYVDDRQIVESRVRLHSGEPHIVIELEEIK